MINPENSDIDPDVELALLIERAERATGRPFDWNSFDLLPPAWEHAYWRAIIRARPGATSCPRALMEAGGFSFPPADSLEPDALIVRLWQLIRRLQQVNIFISSTDHLSDRDFYSWLRETGLQEFMTTAPGSTEVYTQLDVVSSGSGEDFEVWARYYMQESDREQWREENPGEELPESKPLPHNRDRYLPRFVPYFSGDDGLEDLSWMEEFDDDDEPEEGDDWKRK